MNEIVKYTAEGLENFQVRIDEDTVWLTQSQMVELFQRDKSVISRHIRNIFREGELQLASTVANFATVQDESGREVVRNVEHYNLDVVISVGYRVKSRRGAQFRIWATSVLREHLLKGYTIKQPVTLAHLQEMKQNLTCQIEELRQELENLDIVMNEQYSELYQALIDITSKKKLMEEKPRRRIGFKSDDI
jgi:prophage antirepressor-like protein